MKVLKLNEATNDVIQNAKERFEQATTDNEKLDILGDFLVKTDPRLDSDVWLKIKNFGINFLSKWINAFKWEEAGSTGNAFIKLLNKDDGKLIANNQDIFTIAYNCYAGTDYINDNSLNYNPLFVKSLYKNSPEDIKDIVRMWSRKVKSSKDVKDAIPLFYENTDFKNTSMENWIVKSAAQIRDDLSSNNVDVSDDESDIKDFLKSKRNRDIVIKELRNYADSNLQQG